MDDNMVERHDANEKHWIVKSETAMNADSAHQG